MASFFVIGLIVIFAYGVTTQALIYPNRELDAQLLSDVFFPAFFIIGGEHYTRELLMDGNNEQNYKDILFVKFKF